ncbi:MAG: sugar transferase [Luteolibacter sp.]
MVSPVANTTVEAQELPLWKRISDIGLVLLILPIVLVLALVAACWIRIVSPGNVLFRQTRIGRGGKPFTIYKFRSMELEAPTDVHEAHVEHLIKSNLPMTKLDVAGDARLIKGGCLIRTSGLDELPQLINVLRGEMSLVGPRPCLPKEFALYDAHQRSRFSVQPGLTGQWQVNRSATTTFSEMVRMDDQYAQSISPLVDLNIVLKTPIALLGQMKACAQARAKNRERLPIRRAQQPLRPSTSVSGPLFGLSLSATQKISD